jgi:hypothetical protein
LCIIFGLPTESQILKNPRNQLISDWDLTGVITFSRLRLFNCFVLNIHVGFLNQLVDFSLHVNVFVSRIDTDSSIQYGISVNCKKGVSVPYKRVIEAVSRNRHPYVFFFLLFLIPNKSIFKCGLPVIQHHHKVFMIIFEGKSNAD